MFRGNLGRMAHDFQASYELITSESKVLGGGLEFGKSSRSRKIHRGQLVKAIGDQGVLLETVPN